MERSLKKYFTTKTVDNKNIHFCNSEDCEYQTTIQKDMMFHIRKHQKKIFKFQCDVSDNCGEVFKTSAALEEHKTYHMCGFSIPGMEDIGICGINNLKQYYEMIVDNNAFKYVCKWIDCDYVITRLDCIEKHVHRSHVCPYRYDSEDKTPANYAKNKKFKK